MRKPKLDLEFYPMIVAYADYERAVKASGRAHPVSLCVERNGGYRYVYSYDAFADGVNDAENERIAERLVKTLLWVCGGFRVGVYGSEEIYRRLKAAYAPDGARAFDAKFMSGVYERPFEVVSLDRVPSLREASIKAGGHLEGCRIGFDAGGSDRKVSAVIDGKAVYSEEVVWHPKTTSDPHYHYDEILTAMRTAASKMPRVDCIGVSSAGVYIDNKIMVSSLFLKVDREKYGSFVRDLYLNIGAEMGVPIEVANDGDVTALAGSLELGEGRVLGIAMGTSEAAGYINADGGLNGWLSELAFAPVDLSESAARDEWSGDIGVGCNYFSQDAVIKLAQLGGYRFREELTPAEKLKEIQTLAERDDPLARQIFEDIGVYLGYTIPWYAKFYEISHVLLLGRVMSGRGGDLILKEAERILSELSLSQIRLHTPNEENRRVGQSIAAASLPDPGGER